MSGIKISALPAVASAALTDIFPVVQTGVTSQESLTQVLALFQGKITSLAAQTQALDMNTHLINNVVDPVSAQDAATKNYVDTQVANFATVFSARLASTVALTVTYANGSSGIGATLTNATTQAALTLDGVAAVANDLVLIKNQASALQNGYYVVTNIGSGSTNWVLTRSTKYDQPSEIQPGDLFVITAGTANANTSWIQTATVAAVGTDSISFSQYSVALPIPVTQGGTGLTTATAYGVIAGGTTSAGAFQPVTPGAAGTMFQSGGAAALPAWSTTTYPATNAINTIMYASSANVLGVITPVNSAVMISSSGGVPSMSTTLPSALTIPQPNIVGVTTNSNAAAGSVGELISSVIPIASATSIPAQNTATSIASISLTAGDWDIWGNIFFINTGSVFTALASTFNTSVALPDPSLYNSFSVNAATTGFNAPSIRASLSGTTTVYLIGYASFAAGTATACGGIYARRVR